MKMVLDPSPPPLERDNVQKRESKREGTRGTESKGAMVRAREQERKWKETDETQFIVEFMS